MGIASYIGKKVAQAASGIVTGAANEIIDKAGNIANNATNSINTIRNENLQKH